MSTSLTERPPIVVVMGHVDHGKSTLLDFIRKSNIVAGEAGGITQHVAAYEVEHCSPSTGVCKRITFIDTPGHAAFGAIRARGANIADIAILVVAADDGVKAQTLEALAAIREAKIPFVVAINKIDKPNANIERTQASLMEHAVYLEQLGGDVPWASISAKAGTGVDELLDLILLVAEVEEYKADADVPATGYVIEAHRDQKRGVAATLIITAGTIKSGMAVTAGHAVTPVRIMEDHAGKALKSATFSTPVQLVGFDELPDVGATFSTHMSKKEAEAARDAYVAAQPKATATAAESTEGRFMLPIIVRADVTGSLEAILSEAAKLGNEHRGVSVVQSGIGSMSESDVKAALATNPPAVLVGFNVGIDPVAESLALERGVRFERFSIIYKLTETLTDLMKDAAPKRTIETIVGRAKIIKVFSSRKDEHLVGGKVVEGYLAKKAVFRVVRKHEPMGEGAVVSMQANRTAVDRVDEGGEFGAQISTLVDLNEGDTIEAFTTSQE